MTEVLVSVPALPNTSRPALPKTNPVTRWLPPVGLIVLSLIPVLAGAVRLIELMGSPEITANNARFVASPIPVAVHIVSLTVFSLLGAMQFVPSLRRGRPNWHRIAGRILVPAVAECVIRRRPTRRSNPTSAGLGRPATARALADVSRRH